MKPAMILAAVFAATVARAEVGSPRFARHVEAVFSRLGCNGGGCHGAVQGKNGFRLSLFGADPAADYDRVVRESLARRIDLVRPEQSLLLLKAAGRIPHGGGVLLSEDDPEYALLRAWIAGGARLDPVDADRTVELVAEPAQQLIKPGETARLKVKAKFADGSIEDVTGLCRFESAEPSVATAGNDGSVRAAGVGDASIVIRFRSEPTVAGVVVPRASTEPFVEAKPHNFIDKHILDKLRRLNIPPAPLADDATFLRRVTLDVAGRLPTAAEVRAFLSDKNPDKRTAKIDALLASDDHAALWTLKFCDLLKAADFGVYADALKDEEDAPRFAAWIRARLRENTPYDKLAERILTATSREGRTPQVWADEVVEMMVGYRTPRTDLDLYAKRQTLDLYWQRKDAGGVTGALQVAHAFLGLRMECARCHRHPHDVWRQEDLLGFANFFMRVKPVGFNGNNEKKFPENAALNKSLVEQSKKLADEAKSLKGSKDKKDKTDSGKANDLDRRSKVLVEAGRRILNSEVRHLPEDLFATVTSPLGTQSGRQFRLPGSPEAIDISKDTDPRLRVVEWMRRPDNPYFARAIINRIWAHYLGRGIVDPPDHLSPLNPASHPELLAELSRDFVAGAFDLRRVHRAILLSRTYQQSSTPEPASRTDRANYAFFHYRRLPAEVLVDAVDHATGTVENLDMKYHHWPDRMRAIEMPFAPKNEYVRFLLENFGKPKRNSAIQCDCERDTDASLLQVLGLANHPRIRQKVADAGGTAARIAREQSTDDARIDELFLHVLARFPDEGERAACRKYLGGATSPVEGLQGVLWSLVNTREFLLQH